MPHILLQATLRSFAKLLGRELASDIQVTGVAVDSRLVKPGYVFFALPGARADGHQFLSQVAKSGAVAAVVLKEYAGPACGIPLIPVDDVLAALQKGAHDALAALRGKETKVIGITGSMGKTTTKEFLKTLLEAQFCVVANVGSYNGQIGLPLTILNGWLESKKTPDIWVLEMGMSSPGEISQLLKIAPPDIAIITAVTLAHAMNFNDVSDISRAKGEIFSHPRTQLGFVNQAIPAYDEVCRIGTCAKNSFSTTSMKVDYYGSSSGALLTVRDPSGKRVSFNIPVPGIHNHQNALAAIILARAVGMSWEEIAAAVPNLQLPERRFQFVERRGVTFVNDAYNANVDSMKAALQSLPAPKRGGRRLAVLGEMVELGKFSRQCHEQVAECALKNLDELFCVGAGARVYEELWLAEKRPVHWFASRAEASASLSKALTPGDVVLLKGGRTLALEKVLEEL